MNDFSAVDIFAGGGGLTVGLKKAGFKVRAAVELDKHACETYASNHREVSLLQRRVEDIHGEELLPTSGEPVHLLAACPPCQGFSTLTSKYHREDPRNKLIGEVTRIVKEVLPLTIMLENVPGMSTKGRLHFEELQSELAEIGYISSWQVLQVADFGVPQRRRRLVLLAGLGFAVDFPKASHSPGGRNGLMTWRTVEQTIHGLGPALTLSEAIKLGGPAKHNWHVVRDMSPTNLRRIRSAQPGNCRSKLPDELRPPCHRGSDRGFHNVYGRLRWDQPSVTITAGCTTFSKGRFGHPEEDRTLSLREAALLQTFPRRYKFPTVFMEKACQIVGNALPCLFAQKLAAQCRKALVANGHG